MVEPARAETEDALRARFDGNDQRMHLGRALAILTPSQLEEIESRIDAIVSECLNDEPDLDDPDAKAYAFTYTLVPTGMVLPADKN